MRGYVKTFALLLVAAVACGKGTSSGNNSGNQGQFGQNFSVTVVRSEGGTVQSGTLSGNIFTADGHISCSTTTTPPTTQGGQATTATNGTCSFTYPASATVVLKGAGAGTNAFAGWAGDCAGASYCTLTSGADKTVVAIFGPAGTTMHPNFASPADHDPAYMAFANGTGALQCNTCHGGSLQGSSIAPACNNCHVAIRPAGQSTGLVVAVTSVTKDASTNPVISVRFTLKDDQGKPVDLNGNYSINAPMSPRFALARIDTAADGQTLPYAVLTATGTKKVNAPGTPAPAPSAISLSPTAIAPSLPGAIVVLPAATAGTLVENGTGAGDYTYTFPTGGVTAAAPASDASITYTGAQAGAADATKLASTHTIWIQLSRQTILSPDATSPEGFITVNKEYNFVPNAVGVAPVASANKRELVTTANCNKCHNGFKPAEATNVGGFHGYGRIDGKFCDICHNPARTSNPAADAMVFIHRIHKSEELLSVTTGTQTVGNQDKLDGTKPSCSSSAPCTCTVAEPCRPTAFHAIDEVTYPQDIRNCNECHGGAAQGNQWQTRPTRAACGSCHDNVVFTATATAPYVPHSGGAQTDDSACSSCHGATTGMAPIVAAHTAVADPDPNNIYIPWTANSATAGYQGGTLTDCTVTNACSATVCKAADKTTGLGACYNPATFASVTSATTTGSLLVGGKTCGAGPAGTAVPPCTCTVASPCIGAGNNNTNAASLASAGAKPAGAAVITYEIQSVSVDASKHPIIVFKLKNGGSDVTFNTYQAGVTTELIDGFVGAPSLYFVFGMPQDGIATPADFNASASAYLKDIWMGNKTVTVTQTSGTAGTGWKGTIAGASATCTDAVPCPCSVLVSCSSTGSKIVAATLTGPDAANSNFYTATFTGVTVPAGATQLTGGVGYTYGLSTTQPLTQINLAAYPYDATTKVGGLVIPAPNVYMPATGFAPRRAIVSTDRCNACHTQLGAAPTFHAGQRNDGPTCSWCHNPNRTSSAWSANASTFIHGIHGSGKRSVGFNWHAACPVGSTYDAASNSCKIGTTVVTPSPWYSEVTYPNESYTCTQCHEPGTYDFTAPTSTAAIPNLLWSTVGTGKYSSASISQSPYIAIGSTDYGTGYTFNSYTGGYADAAPTTLVSSPVTAACASCHDTTEDVNHMNLGGGSFYAVRITALALPAEKCLTCHGAAGIAPIGKVHKHD